MKEARKKIDAIDKQMIKLFEERLALVSEIAEYKKKNHISIFDEAREKEVLNKALDLVDDVVLHPYVESFMLNIMDTCKRYQKNKNNQFIFLIGMPGAGKTVVGKALAKSLDVAFYDLDQMIQERAGKSLQNIIIYDGEPAFRELEYEVIKELIGKVPGVIATGGGTVTSSKTTHLMCDSGIVVFIHRDVKQILDDLDLEIRPLLKENIEYIFQIYEERCPLYNQVSHIQIHNASSIDDAVQEIKEKLPKEFLET